MAGSSYAPPTLRELRVPPCVYVYHSKASAARVLYRPVPLGASSLLSLASRTL